MVEESTNEEAWSKITEIIPINHGESPPAADKIRVVCFGDTHCRHNKLPPLPHGDILIHMGDFSSGDIKSLKKFNTYMGKQPHKHKIVIGGNHDLFLDAGSLTPQRKKIENNKCAHPGAEGRALLTNMQYIEEESAQILGYKIYGCPYTPMFWGAFTRPEAVLKPIFERIPLDTDILVTHGPPLGVGDVVKGGKAVGHEGLRERVEVVRPLLHVFGHIHEGYGVYLGGEDIIFVNAATPAITPALPIVIDLPRREHI